ncbi:radical SAM protein [Desulfococcus sp.]|uniref:radical SAM protein n=1 Tax=Desulfococcus sp. TaxID=2025834 RepID=UPI0035934DEC
MQTYRIADHRLFTSGGRHFLYLSRDNALFEADRETRDWIRRYGADAAALTRAVEARRQAPASEAWAELENLLARRVILREAEPADVARAARTPEVPLKTLVLHVTDACNLGCTYCYHGRSASAEGPDAGRGRAMPVETAKRAVDFLMDASAGLEEVVLVFFGGEPLLNLPLMAETVGYARQRSTEAGKKVSFAVTTNGTLLTPRAIAFLHANDIGVTVSMDGIEPVHDRFRRFPDGSPSYRAILPGVRALLTAPRKKPVVARVTVAGAPDHVPRTLDHLLAMGFSEAGFAPVTTDDRAFQLDAPAMERLLDQFRLLSARFLETALAGDFLGFTNLVDLLVALHEGEVKTHPCGAGLGLFSVSPDGRLYLCQRLTGREEGGMGDLEGGLDRAKVDRFRAMAGVDRKSECRSCWVRAVCAGGCYHEALTREGSLTAPNRHYCEWIKTWTAMGLDVYARLFPACPDYLDKLSMLRGHAPLHSRTI